MKRLIVCLVLSLLLLSGLPVAAAADFGGVVSADYQFGTLKSDWAEDADLNGFLLRAEVPVAAPFGVFGEFAFLNAKDVTDVPDVTEEGPVALMSVDRVQDMKVTDGTLYATYALPIGPAEVQVLGGYGAAKFEWDIDPDETVKGFKLGARAEFKPMEQVTVEGLVAFGLGTKWDFAEESRDAKATDFRLSAAYEFTPGFAVEGGYSYTKYTADAPEDGDSDWEYGIDGFFLGVRAMF